MLKSWTVFVSLSCCVVLGSDEGSAAYVLCMCREGLCDVLLESNAGCDVGTLRPLLEVCQKGSRR